MPSSASERKPSSSDIPLKTPSNVITLYAFAVNIIEAYEKAKEEKSGVTTVDGVLVEELHVKQSLALISKMKMIQSMS